MLCAAMMMIIRDGTIVTVALPAIQRDLGFSSSGLAWVVNAYLIAFGGLLLAAFCRSAVPGPHAATRQAENPSKDEEGRPGPADV